MAHGAPIDWGVASRPKPGEKQCGDREIVVPFDGGVLIAVVDALGHGDEAAASAKIAELALREHPSDSVISQVKFCHMRLRGQRGVVMSLAKYDAHPGLLSWLSVGNVEGIVLSPGPRKARLVTRGGVVGSSLPELRAEVLDVSNGGLLVFATDGIDSAFGDTFEADSRTPTEVANDLMRRSAKSTDDALVLVARFAPGQGS